MIFDSHAHFDESVYDNKLQDLVISMKKKGVTRIINISCDIDSIKKSYNLAKNYDIFYTSSGIHPLYCEETTSEYLNVVKEYALKEKNVAIGEIGLDYFKNKNKELQKKFFKEQLNLAKELNMPVIIHCRDAYEDTFDLLKESGVIGVIHCYSGSKEMMYKFLSLGFYISFTGIVTFKNAKKALECLKNVPDDKLLIETDSPYLSPEPLRGTVNNSSNIHYISEVYSQVREQSKDYILNLTYKNACRLFKIN